MTSNSDCSKSKTCDWWSSSARRSAIPIRNAKQELVEAGLDEEARRNPDAIEAVFRKLNADDEAEAARRNLLWLSRQCSHWLTARRHSPMGSPGRSLFL